MPSTRKALVLVLTLLASLSCFARVTQGGEPRWIIATPDQLPINAAEIGTAPWIDGWMIRIEWADGRIGQVATDTTVCTVAPCTETNSFATLDADIKTVNGGFLLTCGALLHNNAGHPCWVNFSMRGISNPSNYNLGTPTWVFSQAWQQTVGAAAPQSAAFCAGYPQNASQVPLPPVTGTANINTSNCGVSGTTQCTASTVSTGVTAYFQQPYLVAFQIWKQQFLSYLAGASYLSQVKYVNIGTIGTGDENSLTCATVAGGTGTGMESLVTPANDAGLKAAFLGAVSSHITFVNTLRHNLGLDNAFTLTARFNMGQGLTAATATDPTWAVSEAGFAAALPNWGGGSNGWKNGSGASASDLIDFVGAAAACVIATIPPCLSNNWGGTLPTLYGHAVYMIAQLCNTTNPAGGGANCQDASLSGTGNQEDTMWQFMTLAAAAGINVIELSPKDVQCIANVLPQAPCASGNAIQLSYAGAAQAYANGKIPVSH